MSILCLFDVQTYTFILMLLLLNLLKQMVGLTVI